MVDFLREIAVGQGDRISATDLVSDMQANNETASDSELASNNETASDSELASDASSSTMPELTDP